MRSALAVFCAILLPCAIAAQDAQYSQSTPPPQAAPVPQQNVPLLSPQQLDNLVAPVALYPDPLLGQVLAASTYPLEVVEAQQWMQENSSLHGSQLMDAAKQQNWDPSVQAMVAFPDVMSLLTRDIRWTTDLGNAFLAQQSDLMAAVQRMRARAEQNGRLSSNAQESVTTATEDGQSAIQIQPADPQVVYVPVYNPEYVWGPPAWGYYPSLWYPPVSYGCGFNAGIFMGGFFAGFGGWGGWGWGLGWFGHGLYVNSLFFNHFGFHGYYGGYGARAMWAHDPMHRMGVAYPNRALSARYGNARFAGGRYNAGFANRGGFSGNRAGAGYNGGFRNGAAGYGNSARAGAGNSYRGGVNRGASSSGSSYRGSNGGSSGYRSFNSAGRAVLLRRTAIPALTLPRIARPEPIGARRDFVLRHPTAARPAARPATGDFPTPHPDRRAAADSAAVDQRRISPEVEPRTPRAAEDRLVVEARAAVAGATPAVVDIRAAAVRTAGDNHRKIAGGVVEIQYPLTDD